MTKEEVEKAVEDIADERMKERGLNKWFLTEAEYHRALYEIAVDMVVDNTTKEES